MPIITKTIDLSDLNDGGIFMLGELLHAEIPDKFKREGMRVEWDSKNNIWVTNDFGQKYDITHEGAKIFINSPCECFSCSYIECYLVHLFDYDEPVDDLCDITIEHIWEQLNLVEFPFDSAPDEWKKVFKKIQTTDE